MGNALVDKSNTFEGNVLDSIEADLLAVIRQVGGCIAVGETLDTNSCKIPESIVKMLGHLTRATEQLGQTLGLSEPEQHLGIGLEIPGPYSAEGDHLLPQTDLQPNSNHASTNGSTPHLGPNPEPINKKPTPDEHHLSFPPPDEDNTPSSNTTSSPSDTPIITSHTSGPEIRSKDRAPTDRSTLSPTIDPDKLDLAGWQKTMLDEMMSNPLFTSGQPFKIGDILDMPTDLTLKKTCTMIGKVYGKYC